MVVVCIEGIGGGAIPLAYAMLDVPATLWLSWIFSSSLIAVLKAAVLLLCWVHCSLHFSAKVAYSFQSIPIFTIWNPLGSVSI